MRVGRRVNELHIHPHLIVRLLHAPFENVHHTELLRDLRQIIGRALETLRRGTRDHFQIGHFGQAREDFILHAFGEIGVLRVATEIIEWQHRDRFLRDRGLCGRHDCCRPNDRFARGAGKPPEESAA